MKVQSDLNYIPSLGYRTRVRLIRKGHAKCGQTGVVVAALPNPSKLPEKQWYDVRFEDWTYVRIPERDLAQVA